MRFIKAERLIANGYLLNKYRSRDLRLLSRARRFLLKKPADDSNFGASNQEFVDESIISQIAINAYEIYVPDTAPINNAPDNVVCWNEICEILMQNCAACCSMILVFDSATNKTIVSAAAGDFDKINIPESDQLFYHQDNKYLLALPIKIGAIVGHAIVAREDYKKPFNQLDREYFNEICNFIIRILT